MSDKFGKIWCALHAWGETTQDPKRFDDLPSIVQHSVRKTCSRDYMSSILKKMEENLETSEIPPEIDIAITKVYQEEGFMAVEYQY